MDIYSREIWWLREISGMLDEVIFKTQPATRMNNDSRGWATKLSVTSGDEGRLVLPGNIGYA